MRNTSSFTPYTKLLRSFQRDTPSFTLIELLIVIGILAVLVAAVVLTLNPAQLLAQARDSKRQQDLSALNQALNTVYALDQTVSFGASSTVYTSLPDASSTCGSWGLPSLPSGWNYNCVSTTTLQNTNGTGWIPVNFQSNGVITLSSLPIDPVNASSSNLYYTYITGGSFKLTATMESTKYASLASSDGGTISGALEMGSNLALGQGIFPSGWIRVPGDSRFSTSDFYVMKYDAKCLSAITSQPLSPPIGQSTNTNYNTYANNVTPCTSTNNLMVASTPSGWPIANITQTDAASYCASLGAHLITNNEWQTISWNAQNNPQNWSGNAVGSGYIYSGHNDNAPATALEASSDDSQGYYGETNTGGNQKRTLSLSNGQVIWDMAGNIWQWTNDTITGANEPTGATPGFAWREFTAITTWGTMSQQTAGPLNASWNSSQGIGQIYSDGTPSNSTVYGFLRGGSWFDGGGAGVATLGLIFTPGAASGNIGFRCAR